MDLVLGRWKVVVCGGSGGVGGVEARNAKRKKRSMEWMDELADDVGEGVLGEAVEGGARAVDKVVEVVEGVGDGVVVAGVRERVSEGESTE